MGGKSTGANPTDRGKLGVKRSLLVEAAGIPIGLAVDGANRHDCKMVEETWQSVAIERPAVTPDTPQGMCMDKGYDSDAVFSFLVSLGFTPHIRTRGEEQREKQEYADYKPHRWVVERTHGWLNRFRRLLIRWEKKPQNYTAFLHLAFAYIALRQARLTG